MICYSCKADLTGKAHNQRFGIGVDLAWCDGCPVPARKPSIEAKLAKLGARGEAPAPASAPEITSEATSSRKDGKRILRAKLPNGELAERTTANTYAFVVAVRKGGEWWAECWTSRRDLAEKKIAYMQSKIAKFTKPGWSCRWTGIEAFEIVPVL